MRPLKIYTDSSVIGGCEDHEFAEFSCKLWECFIRGEHILCLSDHTLREIEGAPAPVAARIEMVPMPHKLVLADSEEATSLAAEYLHHGIVGPGSRADALHVALAAVARVDVLVSWNFKHIVNLGRIRLFNAVNLERGYGTIEIRTPEEVLDYD